MNSPKTYSFESDPSSRIPVEDIAGGGLGCSYIILAIVISLLAMGGFAFYKHQKTAKDILLIQEEAKRLQKKEVDSQKTKTIQVDQKKQQLHQKLLGEALEKLDSPLLEKRQQALQMIREKELVGALYQLKSRQSRETNFELAQQMEELIAELESLLQKRSPK